MAGRSSTDEERRRQERVEVKIPVDYSAVDAFFTEFAGNINAGGIFIETDSPAEAGTSVMMQCRLPGLAAPVAIRGRVAWVSDGKEEGSTAGMGIQFQDLDDEIRDTINTIVRNLRQV